MENKELIAAILTAGVLASSPAGGDETVMIRYRRILRRLEAGQGDPQFHLREFE
jgi:hypothetical protein